MKTWLIGAAVVALAGGVYLTRADRTRPTEPAPPAPTSAPVAVAPVRPAPAVLPTLVSVTDVESLLDPPAIPVTDPTPPTGPILTAVGYEEPVTKPAAPPTDVPPIPPAVEDEPAVVEVAPMPREVRVTTADTARRGWYGDDRLPRQLGVRFTSEQWLDEFERLAERRRDVYHISGPVVGIRYRW